MLNIIEVTFDCFRERDFIHFVFIEFIHYQTLDLVFSHEKLFFEMITTQIKTF